MTDQTRQPYSLFGQLRWIALGTLIGMTLFEATKQAIHPEISIWQSHTVTIAFSTLVATVAGYFVLHRIRAAHQSLLDELGERRRVEGELRALTETLELRAEERAAELREAEEALVRAERLASMGTLSAGLAHEIKNPIAALLTSAQAALNTKDRPDGGDRLERSLRNIAASAERCNAIVDRLRRFAGGQPTERQLCDLNEVVCEALDSIRAFTEDHRARAEFISKMERVPVLVGASEIQLLLLNLVRNSVQAGSTRIVVELAADRATDRARLTVTDDGEGLADDVKRRAFEPFYSTRRDQGGMGLGLSIAHGVAVGHGGSIRFDSEVCDGAAVVVELPVEPEEEGK